MIETIPTELGDAEAVKLPGDSSWQVEYPWYSETFTGTRRQVRAAMTRNIREHNATFATRDLFGHAIAV